MTLKKSFILAVNNLLYDKMRSLLTMLGIIIGVAAVIILISLMDGMMGMVDEQFAELGVDSITVTIQNRGGSRTIDEDDMYAFAEENPNFIKAITPTVTVAGAEVRNKEYDLTTSVTGVDEHYYSMKQLNMGSGQFFQYVDVEKKRNYCVIGTYIEKELFGTGAGLGQNLKINGRSFTVIGVLQEEGDSTSGSQDDVIYIPYTAAVSMSSSSFIGTYTAQAANADDVNSAVTKLEQFLLTKIGDSDYYNVSSVKQIMDMASTITDSMQTLLVCIAGISLLVGGIGIMNIMLVSVTERTREIGIRKSLGAKGRDIKSQFVIEAATVSGVGGIIGIIAGSILSVVFGNMLGLTAYPSLTAIGIAFGVSVAIGIMFGYLPAKNAANLNPIDALRHE
ncbi:MAG TPA: ABC transporter permease [Candidatus Monoglobus merdigallinarum]|uniref:ABC transporter permease n=1 Tax=Candidatus Monoglobus merdigallinarum TaxID=2838698 RepID=A0A9D1TM65_9FIRM|nr:ABC transporter permease [Candidatus Monoglobus merdigallinarum]